jgi:hypothetical protein
VERGRRSDDRSNVWLIEDVARRVAKRLGNPYNFLVLFFCIITGP